MRHLWRARSHTPVTERFFDGGPLRKHPLDDSTSRGVGLSNHQGGKYRLQSSFAALHECQEHESLMLSLLAEHNPIKLKIHHIGLLYFLKSVTVGRLFCKVKFCGNEF